MLTAAGDVRGYLGVWSVLGALSLWGEVVFQTGLPQRHQRCAVSLDGARLPYRRGDARDADLHHRLVIVVGQIVLSRQQIRGQYNYMYIFIRFFDKHACAWTYN